MLKQLLGQPLLNLYRRAIRDSRYRSLVILGSLVYLISPIDISPDVFPVVGWIDDGVVATLAAAEIAQILLEQRRSRQAVEQQKKQAPQAQSTIDVDAVSVR